MSGIWILSDNSVISGMEPVCLIGEEQMEQWQRNNIDDFFSRLSEEQSRIITEKSCTELANELLDATDARPTDHQGSSSFTLISAVANKILQYRRFPFDQQVLDLAQIVYEGLTPKTTLYQPPHDFPFTIYIAEVAQGSPLGLHEPSRGHLPLQLCLRTTKDLAAFIGKAVRFPQAAEQTPNDSWTKSARSFLDSLLCSKMLAQIAPELIPIIVEAKRHVHLLKTLPLVLTHKDHGMINLLVDLRTGELTAVLDWDYGGIEAFGMTIISFYEDFTADRVGNEIVFWDHLTPSGESVRLKLEAVFWEQLWRSVEGHLSVDEHGEAVRTAAVIGALNRFIDLETLDEINQRGSMDPESGDHMGTILRLRAYLPKLPQIDQGS